MTSRANSLGQPIGAALPDWRPARLPPAIPIEGRLVRIEKLDPDRHAEGLFAANALDREGRNWTYMPYGPFADLAAYRAWAEPASASADPYFHAILDAQTGAPLGVASYLRIDPANGAIEIGHICFSPKLQRTAAASEAMFLMMRRVFDELGYRRYEWKCDALNAPSRRAALRLGFTFEGVFRQASIYKGRNRDTAWYALIDKDWPARRGLFERWLAPENFAPDGRPRFSLSGAMRDLPATASVDLA